MKIAIITLFPDMFPSILDTSMLRKAQEINAVEYHLISLRDFGLGPRKQVDDTPYGGGNGMLLKIEPLYAATAHARSLTKNAKVLLMTPKGQTWNQSLAAEYATNNQDLILICGHYEGYDERILTLVDAEISIGDYVLTGGELPALTVIDAITRLLPGVLGGENSAAIESFSHGDNLEYPQYTRPEAFTTPDGQTLKVPDVLLSGHHAEIDAWRAAHATKKN
ncbi:tRNA (guanosine(37)-N1)-methyltransferase TrmD [Candidatus Saccharibacteria bacterium]|nr:tRNA (guanosine(37)-N1)-methyltransferase TrmD [Candidatus Saccharibacteria bacterium]